jgi:two-component system, chemotaxis family, chemotaxis protein CheY
MEFTMKFLIVDDSGLSRRLIRKRVEELGHTAVDAADGAAALERYSIEKPDFVFLDLVMPGLSGFEVLALLRAMDPNARIIVCTADVQTSTREIVKQGGAAAIINKPVSLEQISATLNSILAGQAISVSADSAVLS